MINISPIVEIVIAPALISRYASFKQGIEGNGYLGAPVSWELDLSALWSGVIADRGEDVVWDVEGRSL